MEGIFPTPDAIEAELLALKRRREALESAIADRELFLALGRRLAQGEGVAAGGGEAKAGRLPDPPRPGSARPDAVRGDMEDAADTTTPTLTPRTLARARGRELVDEVLAILRDAERPLHAAELVTLLVQRGFETPGRDPVAALNTRLWKRARTGQIVRCGDAVYAAPDPYPSG